jgi:hypothetical protein
MACGSSKLNRSIHAVTQYLQLRETRIDFVVGARAGVVIEILSAFSAQPFAVGTAQNAVFFLNQHLRSDKRHKVEDAVITHTEFGIERDGIGIQFLHHQQHIARERVQAAVAFSSQSGVQSALNEYAFFGAAEPQITLEIIEIDIFCYPNSWDVQHSFARFSGAGGQQETDIEFENSTADETVCVVFHGAAPSELKAKEDVIYKQLSRII